MYFKEEIRDSETIRELMPYIFLGNTLDESVVSLREIARFSKCVEISICYSKKRTENNKIKNTDEKNKNNKLRSIICSIYLCNYIRLTDDKKRNHFENELRPYFIENINGEDNKEGLSRNLKDEIKKIFKDEIDSRPKEKIANNISDFLKIV